MRNAGKPRKKTITAEETFQTWDSVDRQPHDRTRNAKDKTSATLHHHLRTAQRSKSQLQEPQILVLYLRKLRLGQTLLPTQRLQLEHQPRLLHHNLQNQRGIQQLVHAFRDLSTDESTVCNVRRTYERARWQQVQLLPCRRQFV